MVPLAVIGGLVVVAILVVGLKEVSKYLSNKTLQLEKQEQDQNGNK